MSFISAYNAVSVLSTATPILLANNERRGCLIANNDATATIYLGFDSNVTISNGMPIQAGSTLQNSDDSALWRGAIYGITSSGTVDTRYWEWGK